MTVLLIYLALVFNGSDTLFNFSSQADLSYWRIVDDVVMGGRSDGRFGINEEGHGVFEGTVSLENNGGFSSVRYSTRSIDVSDKKFMVVRVKGDGKNYQLRIKGDRRSYYSFITTISTTTEWQEIEIPLNSMYASFRGYQLDVPNFSDDEIQEFAILIGNKKAESFKLLIDSIQLK